MTATPFELGLAADLEIERQRFVNSWLCDWHKININGKHTDVDDHRGGRIQLGGQRFEGGPQAQYWQAIERYLKTKTHEVMRSWDSGTAHYAQPLRQSSLDRTEGILLSFAGSLIDKARVTDRRLRGQGFPDRVQAYDAKREWIVVKEEIARIVSAHRSMLPQLHSVTAKVGDPTEYDVFVCHASEDKATFVDAFANALQAHGLRVWYDSFSIRWGDYPRQRIDEGLRKSRFGVVVLSQHFFAKGWPQNELEALMGLEAKGGTKVLPIWHWIAAEQVAAHSPVLAAKFALKTSECDAAEIADKLRAICEG